MNKANVNDFGHLLGNLIVFVSVFLPWNGINHYGNKISYTGITLTSMTAEFSTIYPLPLLSGVLMCYIAISWLNKNHINMKECPWITLIGISTTTLVIAFFSLLICPTGFTNSKFICSSKSIRAYKYLIYKKTM